MAEEEPVNANREPYDDQKLLRIRRGRVDSVDLYEIKDSELDLIEKGSPADLQLNFCIFLFSVAFSAICALATATFSNPKVETAFTIIAIVGILMGMYLLISWYRTRTSMTILCQRIRGRIPPDVLPPVKDEAPGGDDPGENAGPVG